MKETTRLGTSADLDLLEDFVALGVAEQAENKGGRIWSRRETPSPPFRASIGAVLHDPEQEVIIGLIDEAPVGNAVVGVELLRSGDALGRISQIWVDPEARDVGVGEALIAHVIEWCQARKCVGIDSMALPGNPNTKNFFETFGFKARLLVVHHSLEEN